MLPGTCNGTKKLISMTMLIDSASSLHPSLKNPAPPLLLSRCLDPRSSGPPRSGFLSVISNTFERGMNLKLLGNTFLLFLALNLGLFGSFICWILSWCFLYTVNLFITFLLIIILKFVWHSLLLSLLLLLSPVPGLVTYRNLYPRQRTPVETS